MDKRLFCVKFIDRSNSITISCDVTAQDAAGAIVCATNQLLQIVLESRGFHPVEVWPIEPAPTENR